MQQNHLDIDAARRALLAHAASPWTHDACGVTRAATAIPALLHPDAYAAETRRTRVLLLGGLSGRSEDTALTFQALEAYLDAGEGLMQAVALSAVLCGNPDGLSLDLAPHNGVGGTPSAGYPPGNHFYDEAHNPETRYLWRWVGMQAPDLVLEIHTGPQAVWHASGSASSLGAR